MQHENGVFKLTEDERSFAGDAIPGEFPESEADRWLRVLGPIGGAMYDEAHALLDRIGRSREDDPDGVSYELQREVLDDRMTALNSMAHQLIRQRNQNEKAAKRLRVVE